MHTHFKDEGLSSTLFASAWFITVFTNSLKQNTENSVVNESLLQLWDYFLIDGWVAILKLSVFVLTSNTEELQKLPFEDMMPHINESVRRTLVHSRGDRHNLFKEISRDFSKLHISFHIERLKAEFDHSHQEVTASQPAKNRQITL